MFVEHFLEIHSAYAYYTILTTVDYCFRYFVPYVHIGKFVAMTFKDADGKLPVMCIGITSGIGRLIFGYIADLPKVNRILLQQVITTS